MYQRLPFFFGWAIVAIVFVTVAIAVTARTFYGLLVPPLIGEFGWDRGTVAGAFSFGFLLSAVLGPLTGRMMDRYGPAVVIELGVICVGAGLVLGTWATSIWHLYATLGVLVVTGANFMSYTAQSMYLPNWFVRHRALAIALGFSGAGLGGIALLPWLQTVIDAEGWRDACLYLGIMTLVVLFPLNLMIRRRPEDVGLEPDGGSRSAEGAAPTNRHRIVDAEWAGTVWTVGKAMRTGRFWWCATGFFCALFVWYSAQVHQTIYLLEIGFSGAVAAQALGLVVFVAVPGQIGFGALSDRIGREAVWGISALGFAICFATLIVMADHPTTFLLYVMVVSQGLFGYAMTSVLGPIVNEIFDGPHFASIFGLLTVALIGGGGVGPRVTGEIFDLTGSYDLAFKLCFGLSLLSGFAIWMASPRKVRSVRR